MSNQKTSVENLSRTITRLQGLLAELDRLPLAELSGLLGTLSGRLNELPGLAEEPLLAKDLRPLLELDSLDGDLRGQLSLLLSTLLTSELLLAEEDLAALLDLLDGALHAELKLGVA